MKKNLKHRSSNVPVEDIFEAWRDYLQELDDLLSTSLPSSPDSSRHASTSNDESETPTQGTCQWYFRDIVISRIIIKSNSTRGISENIYFPKNSF